MKDRLLEVVPSVEAVGTVVVDVKCEQRAIRCEPVVAVGADPHVCARVVGDVDGFVEIEAKHCDADRRVRGDMDR